MSEVKTYEQVKAEFATAAAELHKLELPEALKKSLTEDATAIIKFASDVNNEASLQIALAALRLYNENVKSLQNAPIDPLTGLLSKSGAKLVGQAAIEHAHRHKHSFAVFVIDLKGFKAINDSVGHAGGDEALKLVANKLREVLRAEDIKARDGGDEFVVMMSDDRTNHRFKKEKAKIEKLFKDGIVYTSPSGMAYTIGGHVGMAIVAPAEDYAASHKRADKLMYEEKMRDKRTTIQHKPEGGPAPAAER